MKNKQDPIALEDDEYPAWLWGALAESKEKSEKEEKEGDLFGTDRIPLSILCILDQHAND